MGHASTSRTIRAPVERVFDAVAHIENFQHISPDIVKVEFLTEQRRGVGTRFRETRRMGKREGCTELEVTEYVENEHIRLVADQGGTIWDSSFTTKDQGDGTTELAMAMEARPHKLLAHLVAPLFVRLTRKFVEQDLDAVQAHCEGSGECDRA